MYTFTKCSRSLSTLLRFSVPALIVDSFFLSSSFFFPNTSIYDETENARASEPAKQRSETRAPSEKSAFARGSNRNKYWIFRQIVSLDKK